MCDDLPRSHTGVVGSFLSQCLHAIQQLFINLPLSLNNLSNYHHLTTTALAIVKGSYRNGIIVDQLFCSIFTGFMNYAEGIAANLNAITGSEGRSTAILTNLNQIPSPFPMTVVNVNNYLRLMSLAYFGR